VWPSCPTTTTSGSTNASAARSPTADLIDPHGFTAFLDLRAAVDTATYDDANRLTDWGTSQLTYDAAGNLTGDGTDTYTWDAREQLVEIDGPTPATLAYDPSGRRTTKTIETSTTEYVYDGANIVQETRAGGTPDRRQCPHGQHVGGLCGRSRGSSRPAAQRR
jgi:hypothetical protein